MRGVALLVGLAVSVSGCAGAADDGTGSGEVTVLAAASLTNAFEALGVDFEARNPGTRIRFSFAGSQQLATQVLEGAAAGVFASADTNQMDRVADAGVLADHPVSFAGNRLAIAVERGNPAGVEDLDDLADPAVTTVVAAPEVPAGRYASELLASAGVSLAPASQETDVRAVLSKVALGEADAGIVYRSDLVAAGDAVDHVAIPDERNVTATYQLAAVLGAADPGLAAAFVEYVTSVAGQDTLADHGFEPAA